MRKQKKFVFEDDKLVLNIMYDMLPEVMTAEEIKQFLKDITTDARQIIGELITDVKFKVIDLERQIFVVALEGKKIALAIQLEADDADRGILLERLEKQEFVEAD